VDYISQASYYFGGVNRYDDKACGLQVDIQVPFNASIILATSCKANKPCKQIR
jgi:hypothetical protein